MTSLVKILFITVVQLRGYPAERQVCLHTHGTYCTRIEMNRKIIVETGTVVVELQMPELGMSSRGDQNAMHRFMAVRFEQCHKWS